MCNYIEFEALLGKTIEKIDGLEKNSEEVIFHCNDGIKYRMYHDQDCCESVNIEDIIGDISNLIGSPVVMAEEIDNTNEGAPLSDWDESYTWTFYKLATNKGYVTIRWYGTSNGWYSESVSFEKAD